jgi:hypothetical protein
MSIDTVNLIDSNTVRNVENNGGGGVSSNYNGGNHYSIQSTITDWIFYIFVIAAISFVFFQPQIFGSREFYKNCFKKKKKRSIWVTRLGAPSSGWFTFIWLLLHTCEVIAIIVYAYNFRFPATTEDANKFIAVLSLFIGQVLMQKLWVILFFNYHHITIILLFSCLIAFILIFSSLTLVILFGIIGGLAWPAFGLMFIFPIWFTVAFGWNCWIAKCLIQETNHCVCHGIKIKNKVHESDDDENEMTTTTVVAIDNDDETVKKRRKKKHHY